MNKILYNLKYRIAMQQVKRRKALPSVCIHDMSVQFANAGDAKKVKDILAEEPLLEVVTEPQTLTEAQASTHLASFNTKIRQSAQSSSNKP